MPPEPRELAAGADATGLPPGTSHGVSDFKKAAYNGPCPPIGRHRYFHKLYALDVVLTELHKPKLKKADLEKAMPRVLPLYQTAHR